MDDQAKAIHAYLQIHRFFFFFSFLFSFLMSYTLLSSVSLFAAYSYRDDVSFSFHSFSQTWSTRVHTHPHTHTHTHTHRHASLNRCIYTCIKIYHWNEAIVRQELHGSLSIPFMFYSDPSFLFGTFTERYIIQNGSNGSCIFGGLLAMLCFAFKFFRDIRRGISKLTEDWKFSILQHGKGLGVFFILVHTLGNCGTSSSAIHDLPSKNFEFLSVSDVLRICTLRLFYFYFIFKEVACDCFGKRRILKGC